jgi:hypothetical protein
VKEHETKNEESKKCEGALRKVNQALAVSNTKLPEYTT